MAGIFAPTAYTTLVERLAGMGAKARLPRMGEDSDAYTALVLGWMLDVTQASKKAQAASYWKTTHHRGESVVVGSVQMPVREIAVVEVDRVNDPMALIDPMFRPKSPDDLLPQAPIETPKPHVTEASGRSYRVEAAIVDGQIVKPGEPMPPVATDKDN